jgi:23S rRNA (guanine745-N1)-methyltransferase
VNLLQPQDKRSEHPGDSADAVNARRRLLDAGFGDFALEAMVAMLASRAPRTLLDVGCGDGWHTDSLRRALGCEACGLDISPAAIERAAKSYPEVSWVVANGDRRLPFDDASFDCVASINARLRPEEFRRCVAEEGCVLVVLTAADDLVELREVIGGERVERDRTARTIDSFAPLFRCVDQRRVATTATMTRQAIDDILASTYRGSRHSEQQRLAGVESIDITLSRDLLLFVPGDPADVRS